MTETFVPGCIQACNTLEGQEHRFSSTKNHSSYRYMKITCTCGYVHQYMCPCRHVLAVLSNEDCLVPPLFHYRWWKQFTYFYHRHFEDATTINDLNDKLKNWISFIKTNAFHSNGEYKGCYIDDERILKLQTAHNERDEVYQTMEKLLEYAIQHDQYRETVNCI